MIGQSGYNPLPFSVGFYPNTTGPAQLSTRVFTFCFLPNVILFVCLFFLFFLLFFYAITVPAAKRNRYVSHLTTPSQRTDLKIDDCRGRRVQSERRPRRGMVAPGSGTRAYKHRRKYIPGFGTIWDRMAWRR